VPNAPPPTGEGRVITAFDLISHWMRPMSSSCFHHGGFRSESKSPSSGCLLRKSDGFEALGSLGLLLDTSDTPLRLPTL
jgi:hypothetical protein